MRAAAFPAVGYVLWATPAAAHPGADPSPHEPWLAWSWDPWVVVPVAVAGILYAVGLSRLWSNARAGAGIRRWQAACFGAGWLVLALSLVSPVDALGEVLFWVHMVQHELLILVAAPLLVLAAPEAALLWAVPARWRRRCAGLARRSWLRTTWRTLTNPLWAWAIHAALLWGWHVPPLFEASLRSGLVHTLQHGSFFGSGLLFWIAVLRSEHGRWGHGVAALLVFTTALHASALGALLTFAGFVWYTPYVATAPEWGLTALEDQQLGGLIMWMPAGIVYLAAGLALVALWLRESERRSRRMEAGP